MTGNILLDVFLSRFAFSKLAVCLGFCQSHSLHVDNLDLLLILGSVLV